MTNDNLELASRAKRKVDELQDQYDAIVAERTDTHLVVSNDSYSGHKYMNCLTKEEKGILRVLGAALVVKHLDAAKKEYAAL